jgi:hypothetical protein
MLVLFAFRRKGEKIAAYEKRRIYRIISCFCGDFGKFYF